MVLFRALRSHHFHTLLRPQNPSLLLKNPLYSPSTTDPSFSHSGSSLNSFLISSIFHRTISVSPQIQDQIQTESIKKKKKKKKPLDVTFKEAMGLSENSKKSEEETKELKKKSRELGEEVRKLEGNMKALSKKRKKRKKEGNVKEKPKKCGGESEDQSKPESLHALFTNREVSKKRSVVSECLKAEEPIIFKEFSSYMVLFVSHLYKGGYFNDAYNLPRFDISYFDTSYGRTYISLAAERFGKDNQKIAKWLSGNDLKKVALFGCPSLAKKNVFSAKRLRTFFRIQEDTVCSKCVLKQSCKFANQRMWREDTKYLNLAVVMRLITLYDLELMPPQLVVPDEIKASVSRLLNEILNQVKPLHEAIS